MKNPWELIKWIVPSPVKRRIKRQLQDYFDLPTVERSMEHLRRLGFRPSAAVDVGAYKGEWTVLAREIFPDASFLMVEAQEARRQDLEAVKQTLGSGVDYRIALLGAESLDNIVFHELTEAPTGSSVLAYRPGGQTRQVNCRMQTLDTVLAEAGMEKADLMKLDVQGYELEVLRGSPKFLKRASVIVMEVSLIELYQNNPLLQDVLAFMLKNDFVAYDICALMRRASDNILAQIDMIFVSTNSSLARNNGKSALKGKTETWTST